MSDMLAPPTLVLDPPAPVAPPAKEKVSGMVPGPDSGTLLVIKENVQGYLNEVNTLTPRSPEFNAKVKEISTLASKEIVATSDIASGRLLEGSSVAGAKKSGSDVQVRVAGTLADLRSTMEDLAPNAKNTGVKKILGFIPGGGGLQRYFQRYESAQGQLNAIVKSLLSGKEELEKDNAAMEVDRANLWKAMEELNKWNAMAAELDAACVARINELKAQGKSDEASVLESDVLFVIRQRHQDILTQLTVSVQSYMAMGLIIQNNVELMKGVDRARTTTIQALTTAVKVAKALENQQLVLNQIDALNNTTNEMIDYTSNLLKTNTARVHEQAASSGIKLEVLERAFSSIFETMDAIDTFKAQANDSMNTTIGSLSAQLTSARPYIERAREIESAEKAKQIGN